MESRRPRALRRRLAVAASVIGGLVASIAAGVFLIELPGDDLPGIAEAALERVGEEIDELWRAVAGRVAREANHDQDDML